MDLREDKAAATRRNESTRQAPLLCQCVCESVQVSVRLPVNEMRWIRLAAFPRLRRPARNASTDYSVSRDLTAHHCDGVALRALLMSACVVGAT